MATSAASRAPALKGMARKWVLPRVPPACCQLRTVAGSRPAAISLAASKGLKLKLIHSSPSASIWRMAAAEAGNCRPCRHRCGCKASSAAHSGAVRRDSSAGAAGAGSAKALRSALASSSTCFRKVLPWKSGGRG